MKYLSRKSYLFVALGLAILLLIFYFPGPKGSAAAPESGTRLCRAADLPAGLDPKRVVVFRAGGNGAADSRRAVVLEDFQELLLSGNYQILPAGSEAAAAPECFAWKVDLDFRQSDGGDVRLGLSRFGKSVEELEERGAWQEEFALPLLRRAVATRLSLGRSGTSASLRDPDSALLRERLKAMRIFAEGHSGNAAQVLRQAATADPSDSALQYRLGLVLAAWGGQMSGVGGSLRQDGDRLLAQAAAHLDAALKLDPDRPLALASRGRVRRLLGQPEAEADFARAAALWPAYGEASDELVRLRLERGETRDVGNLVDAALRMSDPRERVLRASLWRFLGKSRYLERNPAAATVAYRRALEEAPVEQEALRVEVWGALAGAQLGLGQGELLAPGKSLGRSRARPHS